MRVKVIVLLVLFLALPGVVLAAFSANYNLPISLISSGGGERASTNFRLGDTLGEPVVGEMGSTNLTLRTGYWYSPLGLPLPGDANDDGVVNAVDITKVERIIAGLDSPTPGADANEDGLFNAVDITKVERLIVGLN